MDNNNAVGELHGARECATSPSTSEGPCRLESDLSELKCSLVVSPSARFDGHQRSRPRFAVLIDGENVGARFADDLFRRVSMLGEPTHCQIYGDWRGQKGKQWKDIANSRIGASLIQPLTEPGAKNATDMSMVIGAMDLLHSNEFDGFCLVSGDADFVPLVRRLQEEGRWVYGYAGGRPSAHSLAHATDSFRSCQHGLVSVEYCPRWSTLISYCWTKHLHCMKMMMVWQTCRRWDSTFRGHLRLTVKTGGVLHHLPNCCEQLVAVAWRKVTDEEVFGEYHIHRR